MKEKSADIVREAFADMLGFLQSKVQSGVMNADDVRSILTALEAGGGIRATVKDLAKYYDKSEGDVRNVIHRNLMPKPVRRVTYDFAAFRKVAPVTWKISRRNSGD